MEDKQIIDLYFERSEDALAETQKKYGRYAGRIANNILGNPEDSKECVNSAYYKVWNSIPPKHPNNLATYIGKIVRNQALDMYDKFSAKKRGMGQTELVLDELKDVISSVENVERVVDEIVLREALNNFLEGLSYNTRVIFVRRYWYLSSIKDIAKQYKMSESKVKMSLLRTRGKLKEYLKQKEIY